MSLPIARSLGSARSVGSAAPLVVAAALLVGLAGAVALRIGVGGSAGVRDPWAGLAFGAVLAALTGLAGLRMLAGAPTATDRRRRVGHGSTGRHVIASGAAGLLGAGVLCLVPLVVHLRTPLAPLDLRAFPVWAAVVTAVAVAEEAFLRGALWQALETANLPDGAVLAVTTLAFGLLHVPFYGWDALPLDLAVGLLLGGLRQATGGWAAPAVAHTVADLVGWWLR